MATATKVTKPKKEKKAWIYENGEKRVLEYTPSGKVRELIKRSPYDYFEYVNMRAIMR